MIDRIFSSLERNFWSFFLLVLMLRVLSLISAHHFPSPEIEPVWIDSLSVFRNGEGIFGVNLSQRALLGFALLFDIGSFFCLRKLSESFEDSVNKINWLGLLWLVNPVPHLLFDHDEFLFSLSLINFGAGFCALFLTRGYYAQSYTQVSLVAILWGFLAQFKPMLATIGILYFLPFCLALRFGIKSFGKFYFVFASVLSASSLVFSKSLLFDQKMDLHYIDPFLRTTEDFLFANLMLPLWIFLFFFLDKEGRVKEIFANTQRWQLGALGALLLLPLLVNGFDYYLVMTPFFYPVFLLLATRHLAWATVLSLASMVYLVA